VRARDLGIRIGTLPTGPNNAITDVRGVRVGHTTLVEGNSVRTGITVLHPHEQAPGTSRSSPARTG
jgi:D-aminopeptidase